MGEVFWSYLSKTYKAKTFPFLKLMVDSSAISDEQEITDEPFKYFGNLSKTPEIDLTNSHDI
jgi:hypothetical protein